MDKVIQQHGLAEVLGYFDEFKNAIRPKHAAVVALIYSHCQTLSEGDALTAKAKECVDLPDDEENEAIARVLYEAGVRMCREESDA